MAMGLTPVLWTIQRIHRIGDGAGGKIEVPYSLKTRYLGALLKRKEASSDLRLEQGAHNTLGAGVQTAARRCVDFRMPFPPIAVNEQLVGLDGTIYVVHFIRNYGWSLQVDVEEVV